MRNGDLLLGGQLYAEALLCNRIDSPNRREFMANIFTRTTSHGVVDSGRFGRNGSQGSPTSSPNGNGQSPPPANWLGRLGHYWETYAPFRNPFAKKVEPLDDDVDAGNGVHAITRKTDYWFNRELYQLEEEAKKLAAEWAEKGLPRHDVERVGVFEPEQVLGMKALELFRQWRRRVRVKMQDQIQTASANLNRLIGESRAGVNALEANALERKNTLTQIESLQQFKEPAGVRVGYDRILKSSVGFWIFAGILTVAEFTANFPVFRLLLPMNSTLVQLAATLGEAAESHTWLAGPLVLLQDILLHFEAFLVALIAVVILVLLGKTTGSSARSIVAFSESEAPMAATTIRAHRRQHTFVFVAGLLGIASVLSFMYFSRAQIAETAQSRVHSDSVSLRQAVADQQAAGTDLAKTAATTQRVTDATRTLQQHLDDAAYASTVQRVNNAIVWLNIGLVLAAMTLGFVYKKEDLTDRQGEHPSLKPLRKKLQSLEREALGHAHAARISMSSAASEAGRINHLLESHPLREWQAKQDRLQSVIVQFRGENARVRGLDPANVIAFAQPSKIVFPEVDENEELRRPTELDQLLRDLSEVEDEFVRVADYAIPAGAPSST
jgi:preprotein translocase subunit SecG